jgi:hypothetical protein
MAKRVTDLTADELEKLAAEAWFEASEATLKSGVPVTGREGSKIVKTYPDGRAEVLAAAKPLTSRKGERPRKKRRLGGRVSI